MIKTAGQSLFEVVLVLGVISVIIISLLALSNRSLSNSTGSATRSQAATHAQQAHEWFRAQRDSDYDAVLAKAGNVYCLNELPTDVSGLTAGSCADNETITGTSLIREANIVFNDANFPDAIKVDITMRWDLGQGQTSFTTTNILGDPRTY